MKTKITKLVTVMALILSGCAETVNSPRAAAPAENPTASTSTAAAEWIQIERLGRPAVNEGLVVTNDFLNAFNSIPPTADLSKAAEPVVLQAGDTVTKVQAAAAAAYGVNVSGAPTVSQVVAGFLPDVMRIDTTVNLSPSTTAYNSCLSSAGVLCGGRKIKDDVIDITLSFLVTGVTDGSTIKDNVSYDGVAGNAAQPGHRAVLSGFPYLAQPN